MQLRRKNWHWPSLAWWLAVSFVMVGLKHHYSTATAADLEWTLGPLSDLLEWFTGHEFHRDAHGEWVSESADVRLVKACAGINFMLMSFLAYAWVFRPDRRAVTGLLAWIAGRLGLLCTGIVAAWVSGLLANSLRIMVGMSMETPGWLIDATGTDATQLHRLVGLGIYLPLLSLQIMLGNRGAGKDAVVVPVLLYAFLMIVVPLLTGNALQQPGLFIDHVLSVAAMAAVMCGIGFLWYRLMLLRNRKPKLKSKLKPRSDHSFR